MSDPYKKVFIIGNGFDLDLGMKTRYSDFAKSEYWPFNKTIIGLGNYLRKVASLDKWFDLEQKLLEYAKFKRVRVLEQTKIEDKKAFFSLINHLTQYIKSEEEKEIRKESVAAQVLEAIIGNGYFQSIYSFNYTNLHTIANRLGLNADFKYEHVHGSVKEDSIILGVEENTDLFDGYQYLYKTFSPHYESHSIQYDMLEADEVVFFGHSLGHNDYHYFRSFFQTQCRNGMIRKDGKRITFFTYDTDSRIDILNQLREMNDNKTDLLFNQNKMEIICTKDGGGKKLTSFLERMKNESRGHHDRMMASTFL